MEIHSTSLSFIPLGNNKVAEKSKQTFLANNNDKKELETNQNLSIQNSVNIDDQTTKISGIVKLSDEIKQQTFNPSNSPAIKAYIQENIQTLKQQQSELMPKIDFFV